MPLPVGGARDAATRAVGVVVLSRLPRRAAAAAQVSARETSPALHAAIGSRTLKPKPVVLWCQACQTGYGSQGEVPATCPNDDCRSTDPQWTTTPPYKLNALDIRFLRSLRIAPA